MAKLTDGEKAQLAGGGIVVSGWSGGPRKEAWYDQYGRTFILPVQPSLHRYRRAKGWSLTPPENPEPYVPVDPAEAFMAKPEVMREGPIAKEAEEELFGGLPFVEPERKGRGPDKKVRKKRKKKRRSPA